MMNIFFSSILLRDNRFALFLFKFLSWALLRRDKTAIRHATQPCLLFLSSRCRFEFNSFVIKASVQLRVRFLVVVRYFTHPEVEERFISLPGSLPFFLHYIGNKPLSWPKTDYVVIVLMAGEINTVNTQHGCVK